MIANAVASVTGYKIKKTPLSAGGYKDWCIARLKIPSLTIEVGKDKLKHPLKKCALKDIYKKNKCVLKVLTERIWT